MELSSLQDLMIDLLKDLYDAEMQILRDGPRVADAAASTELQKLLIEHLKQTEAQIRRLEEVLGQLGEEPAGKTCQGMEGILRENREMMRPDSTPDVQDAGLILGQQKIEHYEIAGYSTAVTFATLLGNHDAAKLLAESLDEEEKEDKKLARLARKNIHIKTSGPDTGA